MKIFKLCETAFSVISILILTMGLALAQNITQCEGTLFRETIHYKMVDATALSILQVITEDQFNEAKKGLDLTGSAVIGGIPFTQTTSWSDFNQQRNAKLSAYKSDFSQKQAVEWTQAYLSPQSGSLYRACIDGITAGIVGTRIKVLQATPSSTILKVEAIFTTDGHDTTIRNFEADLVGGTISKRAITQLSQKFKGSKTIQFLVQRESIDKDFGIEVLTTNSSDASSTLTLLPQPHLKKLVRHTKDAISPMARALADSYATGGPTGQCARPDPGWTISPPVQPASEPECHRERQSNAGRCYWGSWDAQQACVIVTASSQSDKATATNSTVHAFQVQDVWEPAD